MTMQNELDQDFDRDFEFKVDKATFEKLVNALNVIAEDVRELTDYAHAVSKFGKDIAPMLGMLPIPGMMMPEYGKKKK